MDGREIIIRNIKKHAGETLQKYIRINTLYLMILMKTMIISNYF